MKIDTFGDRINFDGSFQEFINFAEHLRALDGLKEMGLKYFSRGKE